VNVPVFPEVDQPRHVVVLDQGDVIFQLPDHPNPVWGQDREKAHQDRTLQQLRFPAQPC
jgi:hypothetical protein